MLLLAILKYPAVFILFILVYHPIQRPKTPGEDIFGLASNAEKKESSSVKAALVQPAVVPTEIEPGDIVATGVYSIQEARYAIV